MSQLNLLHILFVMLIILIVLIMGRALLFCSFCGRVISSVAYFHLQGICVCLCLRIWGFMAINGDVILYILILLCPNDCLPSLSLSFLVSLSLCLLLSPEMDVDACSIFAVVCLYFVALHIQHIFYCD